MQLFQEIRIQKTRLSDWPGNILWPTSDSSTYPPGFVQLDSFTLEQNRDYTQRDWMHTGRPGTRVLANYLRLAQYFGHV